MDFIGHSLGIEEIAGHHAGHAVWVTWIGLRMHAHMYTVAVGNSSITLSLVGVTWKQRLVRIACRVR